MHGNPIRQQYHPQIPAIHLCNRRPTPDASVGLYYLTDWFINHPLNPFQCDERTVGTMAYRLKVLSELHYINTV